MQEPPRDEPDKPFDASDKDQVVARAKAIALARERDTEEFRAVLQTHEGRAVIWRFLSQCGIYHIAPHDAGDIARFEGSRDVGIWLLNECFTSDSRAYSLMQMENQDRVNGDQEDD
jgi:hypothetical protein